MSDDDAARKRRKGTRAGLLMIALGVASSVLVYLMDRNSLDYFRMTYAWDLAVVHAVLWTVAGLIVIGWHNRPVDHTRNMNGRDGNDPYS